MRERQFGSQEGEGFEYHLLALGLAAIVILEESRAFSLDRLLTNLSGHFAGRLTRGLYKCPVNSECTPTDLLASLTHAGSLPHRRHHHGLSDPGMLVRTSGRFACFVLFRFRTARRESLRRIDGSDLARFGTGSVLHIGRRARPVSGDRPG